MNERTPGTRQNHARKRESKQRTTQKRAQNKSRYENGAENKHPTQITLAEKKTRARDMATRESLTNEHQARGTTTHEKETQKTHNIRMERKDMRQHPLDAPETVVSLRRASIKHVSRISHGIFEASLPLERERFPSLPLASPTAA